MAKRQSASSQRAKLVSMSAAALRRKPLSKKQKDRLASLAALPDSEIDFSDIPELSAEQLHRQPAKELVSMCLDADIAAWLRAFGPGYSTRINTILRAFLDAQKKERA